MSSNSEYLKALQALEALKCPDCDGEGKEELATIDDPSGIPEDQIPYASFICPDCKGTGFKPEILKEHYAAVNAITPIIDAVTIAAYRK